MMCLSADILKQYPTDEDMEINKELDAAIRRFKKKWVVLDDDPTGVQTVHDISIFTHWDEESIRQGFEEENNMFFILTNSRGATKAETINIHKEIATVVHRVAVTLGKEYMFISRSDSTLRGHYPLETQLLSDFIKEKTGAIVDGEILCPFFPEGGRYTIGNIHYVKNGQQLIPAGETEFAKDKTFGYCASDLTEYVEEKTGGLFKKESVTAISLERLRSKDVRGITEALLAVRDFNKIIVNAVSYMDLKVFALALYKAMEQGRRFMFRSAAALVKVLGGICDQPLLNGRELLGNSLNNAGIVIIGSYTAKTTAQLDELRQYPGLEFIEFDSDRVLEVDGLKAEINRVLSLENRLLNAGRIIVVYTKRQLLCLDGDTKEKALVRSANISDAVSALIGRLEAVPGFIVAKGGITSSDVGKKALGVMRATVLGQIKPGIPVWRIGNESKFPGIPYVIFPGNVGEDTTLREVVEILAGKSDEC